MMQRNREPHYILMLEYFGNTFLQDDLAMESPQLNQQVTSRNLITENNQRCSHRYLLQYF